MEDKDRPILETGIWPRQECQKGCKSGDKTGLQVGFYIMTQRLQEEDEFTGVVYDIDCLPAELQNEVFEALEVMEEERSDYED